MEPTLTVEARVVDAGPPAPLAGFLHALGVVRYAVERVLHGRYPHDVLIVAFDGVDITSADFAPGTRHRLELTRGLPETAAPINAFPEDQVRLGVYLCLRYEVLP